MRRIPFHNGEAEAAAIERAVDHLARGGILVHPTEAIYGFGCALDNAALERLRALKHRESARPFLLLVAESGQAPGLAWNDDARRLAAAFWPGPLTLALPAPFGDYPDAVVSDKGTVAIRVPGHPGMRALLRRFGAPMTSTSINLSGGEPATGIGGIEDIVDAIGASDDTLVLDGGPARGAAPSTVVDFSTGQARVVRPGAIASTKLAEIVELSDD